MTNQLRMSSLHPGTNFRLRFHQLTLQSDFTIEPTIVNVHCGTSVSDAKRLKDLEIENTRLKKLLADALSENEVTREVLRKKW